MTRETTETSTAQNELTHKGLYAILRKGGYLTSSQAGEMACQLVDKIESEVLRRINAQTATPE